MTLLESDRKRGGRITPYQFFLRKLQDRPSSKILSFFYEVMLRLTCHSYACEIYSSVKIGEGLYLGHPYGITISPLAVIGRNCNIHKGVTIGKENRGRRCGYPTIGNEVWMGVNSTIVGKITIGDDVMIAPNTFVNCDVPSHSIVIGNPCRIIPRENATEGYIDNKVPSAQR